MFIYFLNSGREGMTLPLGGPAVDQWHLLECHFGLPLFDASLNQQVSQKIISHQLFSSERCESYFNVESKQFYVVLSFIAIGIRMCLYIFSHIQYRVTKYIQMLLYYIDFCIYFWNRRNCIISRTLYIWARCIMRVW